MLPREFLRENAGRLLQEFPERFGGAGLETYTELDAERRASVTLLEEKRRRRNELSALRALVARAARGEGHVIGLVGEPGVGKSRLAWELTRRLRHDGWYTLEMHATTFGRAASYRPSIDLVRRWFRLEAGDVQVTVIAHKRGEWLTEASFLVERRAP